MKDFDKADLYSGRDDGFSIEPEIARVHRDEMALMGATYIHNESRKIVEIDRLHTINKATAHTIFDKIKEMYSESFPMGEDGYTSGGIHFHLFGVNSQKYKITSKEMNLLLLRCPLFLKICGGRLYGRRNYRHKFSGYMDTDSKSNSICNNAVGSFEFRCNNVFDERILGYYQALVILNHTGVQFEDMVISNILRNGEQYRDFEEDDVNISVLKGFKPGKKQMKTILKNIATIFDVLVDNELPKSKDALMEYLLEKEFITKQQQQNYESSGILNIEEGLLELPSNGESQRSIY